MGLPASNVSPELFNMVVALVAVMFGLLMALLGWLGNRLYNRVDEIGQAVQNIETDLHGQIGVLDRRVTVLEYKAGIHPNGGSK